MITMKPLDGENGYSIKFMGKNFDFLVNDSGNLFFTVYAGSQVTPDTACRDIIISGGAELNVTTDQVGYVEDRILEKTLQQAEPLK